MPLHLLGKKSWNVYNAANVERVRHDEAEAKAREEAREQLELEEDAQRRIAQLRGEDVPALLKPSIAPVKANDSRRARDGRRDDAHSVRKRRRLKDEDDTDRDIRVAADRAWSGQDSTHNLLRGKDRDAALRDHAGHFQLVPPSDGRSLEQGAKRIDCETEGASTRREHDDSVGLRFKDAAGYRQGVNEPWYIAKARRPPGTESKSISVLSNSQGKDVWGNEDPRRAERERHRISASDPFAAMQQAQRQLRQSEWDKVAWNKARLAEVAEVAEVDKVNKRRRSRRESDTASLEGFSLDAVPDQRSKEVKLRGRRSERHHSRHRHRHKGGVRTHAPEEK